MSTAARRVLVTGGSGFLGSHIVRRLVGLGHTVAVLARSSASLDRVSDLPLSVIIGDVTDLRTMATAVRESDVLVYAAGLTSVSRDRGWARSHAVNVVGIKNVIDACEARGVHPRLVVIGTQSNNPGTYATTKRDGELLALGSGLDVTVVRPALVYGPDWRSVFGRLVALVRTLPVIPLVGSGDAEMAPVYVEDVAVGVIRCMEPGTPREVHLSGPERITYRQLLGMLARALGRRPLLLPLPYTLVAPAVRVTTRLWREAPVSEDTLLGFRQEPFAPGAGAGQIGVALTPLAEGVRRTFQQLH